MLTLRLGVSGVLLEITRSKRYTTLWGPLINCAVLSASPVLFDGIIPSI